jgi:hypothetical protein
MLLSCPLPNETPVPLLERTSSAAAVRDTHPLARVPRPATTMRPATPHRLARPASNLVCGHALVPISANSGINLYIGNGPQATGFATHWPKHGSPTHGGAKAGSVPAREAGLTPAEKTVDSLCPFCGVGCQLTYHVKDNTIVRVEGRDGPANHERLCVKGRFGFDYVAHPHRLTKPPGPPQPRQRFPG